MGPVPNCLIFSQGVLVPENTGCQPVVAGNFVQSSFAPRILKSASKSLVSASCRDLQAGSLRSPESAPRAALIGAFLQADRVQVKECLLLGMMRLGRFWFSRFFNRLFLGLKPFGVEDAGLVNALVGVRTEEIALRLQEIRWKASRAITVVIRQRRRKRGDRYPELDSGRNNEPPFRLRSFDGPGEIAIEEKILQRRITLICLNDSIKKLGANDTAAPPNRGDVAEV